MWAPCVFSRNGVGSGWAPLGFRAFGVGSMWAPLGNFEQGSIEAESAIVAQWLTSGLRVAMARTGWHLLSPRLMLTKVPECVLHDYYHKGYPLTPKMADRPYNQYGTQLYVGSALCMAHWEPQFQASTQGSQAGASRPHGI